MESVFETEKEKKQRQLMDVDTIHALTEAGSDLSKPHLLEHHFIVKDLKVANEMSNHLKQAGYGISEIMEQKEEDGNIYFFFDAVKPCMIVPEDVFAQSEKMTLLAKRYNALYDGWGTEVIEQPKGLLKRLFPFYKFRR